MVRRFTQPCLGKARSARIIKKNPLFVADPNGMGAKQPWSANLKKEAARPPGTHDDRLRQACLRCIQMIMGT
jgi:hypothetical protein